MLTSWYAEIVIKSFLGFILTVLLFLSSLGFVVYRLQDPQFIVSQAQSVNFYGRLTNNVSQYLPPEDVKNFGLSNDDVTEVLKSAVSSDQFYGFISSAANAYLPWLTGKNNDLAFSYDLMPIKQSLSTALAAKILVKYNVLPLCTQSQLRTWDISKSLPSCQLAEGTLSAKSIGNQIRQSTDKMLNGLPDSVTSVVPPDKFAKVKKIVALVFKTIYTLWATTLALLLMFLLTFRSRGFISLAVCFLLVGLLEIIFSLIGWDWIARTIGDLISGSSDVKSLVPLIIDLVSVILGAFKTVLGNISIGFLSTGGLLLVLGLVKGIHQPKFVEKVK